MISIKLGLLCTCTFINTLLKGKIVSVFFSHNVYIKPTVGMLIICHNENSKH